MDHCDGNIQELIDTRIGAIAEDFFFRLEQINGHADFKLKCSATLSDEIENTH
jgi:hypothetical protein